MDPVTLALVNGATSGAASAITTEAVAALKKLKELLAGKFGKDSGIMRAVHSLEEQPKSTNRQGVLEEEVAISRADQDGEILAVAEEVLRRLEEQKPETMYKANLTGSGAIAQGKGAVAAGKGGIAVGGNVKGDINM